MTLVAQGFQRKRYDDFIVELQQQAQELWGANINLEDESPLGKWIKLLAFQFAESDELAEAVYNADYIDTAEGIALDHVAKRIGISRIQEEYAKTHVSIEVDPGITVTSGSLVGTTDDIGFITTESVTAPNGGDVTVFIDVDIEALLTGPSGNVPANTIVLINSPLSGVYSVTNPEAATGGRNIETDAEFRERYYKSLAKGGGASTPSIRAALLDLGGVVDAIVDENDSNVVVGGLPANCIAPFVYGGNDAEVAQSIFTYKAGGIQSFGTTVINVTDSIGKVHQIGFSRPNIITINVKITLTKNADYPADGNAQVITNIVNYIGGVDADGTEYDGKGLDADVIHYKTIAAVATISGIDDVIVELSSDGGLTYNQSNIPVDNTSIAQTHYTKVVIQ